MSISTVELSGRRVTPTAIRECFPLSPNMLNSKSDAGLIIFGCSEKSGVEFTNPEIFTIFVIFSKEPKCEFNCDRQLIMHSLAAS